MSNLIHTLQQFAQDHLATDSDHFLITVEQGAKNRRFSVIIDGDKGVSIDYCSQLSRYISRRIDEELGDSIEPFTFEVASPGVDRPLMIERQYPKHVGRSIRFIDAQGTEVKGKLTAVTGGVITVEAEKKEKDKKKLHFEEQQHTISEIKEPKIIVSFK
jgi:ribosome maturation factor RimP